MMRSSLYHFVSSFHVKYQTNRYQGKCKEKQEFRGLWIDYGSTILETNVLMRTLLGNSLLAHLDGLYSIVSFAGTTDSVCVWWPLRYSNDTGINSDLQTFGFN